MKSNVGIAILIGLLMACSVTFASDTHQSGQGHSVIYTITASNDAASPVTNQRIGLAVYRVQDGAYLDHFDNTFKTSSWNTRITNLTYEPVGEFYYRVISIDNGGILSGEYIAIISNDDSFYGDIQAEAFEMDSVSKLIRIHR